MSLKIVFTKEASSTLLSITNFIESRWGKRQADAFLNKTYRKIQLLPKLPFMYKASVFDNNVRKAIISKQNSFFYEIQENKIVILFFWDNRQEPLALTD